MSEGFFAYDFMKYDTAIRLAPPDTFIKLGDLEKEMVRCTTCGGEMDVVAAQSHVHLKHCETCHTDYDENRVKHVPSQAVRQIGAGTVGHSDGCDVVTL